MAVISAIPPSFTPPISNKQRTFAQTTLKIRPIRYTNSISLNPSTSRRSLSISAQSNGDDKGTNDADGSDGDGVDERRRSASAVFDFKRWRDLLSADPENIAAVGLTGLLAWASVQALFQLVFISVAIILAAVKYSFIAALLLFIVITLL